MQLEQRTNEKPSSLILIDVDGTLTNSVCWTVQQMLQAKPNQQMIDWVNKKYAECHVCIIYTARHESYRQETNYWLKKHGVKFHALRMNKIPCSLLVDDRTITPEKLLSSENAKKVTAYPYKIFGGVTIDKIK